MACDFLLIGLTKGSQSFGANFNWFRMDKNDSHYARLTSSVYPIVNCAPPQVGDTTPTAIEHRSREEAEMIQSHARNGGEIAVSAERLASLQSR